MNDTSTLIRAMRIAGALSCALAAGCAGLERSQPQSTQPATEPVAAAAAATETVTAAATQPTPAPAAPASATAAPQTPAATLPPVASTPAPLPQPATPGTAASSQPVAPATPPATIAVKPAPTPPKPQLAVPKATPKPSAPTLDLASLEARLRDTKAIGVFTKISLKNEVDDLLNMFRAYYNRQAKMTLAELRRPYDMLLLKVLSLLQDSDPPLARDIVASREAIWDILANPQKFNEAKLMAGEIP